MSAASWCSRTDGSSNRAATPHSLRRAESTASFMPISNQRGGTTPCAASETGAAMNRRPGSLGTLKLCEWSLSYAVRRWRALMVVLVTMVLKTGLDVLGPWPMKVIADYVLGHKAVPDAIARSVEALSGQVTSYKLLAWSVAAMIVLFLLNWIVGVAESFAVVSLGQRMFYELAADLFGYLQRLSLKFHHSKSVGDSIRRVTTDCMCLSTIVKSALVPAAGSLVSLVVMFT